MKINRGYKFRIYPTKDQEEFINQNIGACRFIYNSILAERKQYYEEHKKDESRTHKYKTEKDYKEEFEWLKQMDSYALCNEYMNLQTAFSNFFRSKKVGFPKFKSKKRDRASYTTSNVNRVIKILDDKHIKLPKIKSLRIKLHRQLPESSKIKSATIERKSSGKYFISLCIEYESQVPNIELDESKSIGLDYSSHDFYVDSNGNKANYPRYFRLYQDKLTKEQRKLSKMKLHSNNYEKQKIEVTKLHEKISNCRLDFLHKLSTQLANNYDIICVEDINMQNIEQCLKLGKSTADNSFGKFRELLKYKLEDRGKKLIKIGRFEPSTVVCSECGAYHKDLVNSLSVREWTCPDCGTHHDRDVNAAKNILKSGLNQWT